MMNQVINTLENINEWMKSESISGTITFRGESSHMVRCGRSQISLNNTEHGQKFFIDLQKGKRKASSSLTCSAEDAERLKAEVKSLWKKIDLMPEISHLRELSEIAQGDLNKHVPDMRITNIDSGIMVDLFKNVDEAFKEKNVEISGAFSAGEYSYSIINTLVDKAISYQGTDFNAEVVVQLLDHDKKEIRTSIVGENLDDYHGDELVKELMELYEIKTTTQRKDLPAGEYDVVFASHAFAELTNYMGYLTYHGEGYQFDQSMLSKDKHDIGTKIFGDNITITDDPTNPDVLFARPIGRNGMERDTFPLIEDGVLKNMFYTDKDTCDRFSIDVNNDIHVASIMVEAGDGPTDFHEMVKSCERPTIYIPFIHYMNFTNPAKGEFTGTSRFGTFLIEDGKITNHLFNLRINDSYMRIFNHVEWLSRSIGHVNTSNTYGMRMAHSVACPQYVKVNGVKISGSSAPKS